MTTLAYFCFATARSSLCGWGMRLLLACASLFLLPQCVNAMAVEARTVGVEDLHCPAKEVGSYRVSEGRYVARGCGRWVQYECVMARYGAHCTPRAEAVVHSGAMPPDADEEARRRPLERSTSEEGE